MKLFDGHCDTAYELWTRGEGLERNSCHIDLQKAAGLEAYAQVFAFCSNAGRPGGGTERLLTEPLALLCREVEKNRSRIGFAANGAEVLRLTEQGRIAALLSVEGCEVIGCDPGRLEWLREQGFCMLTLTWNADNALAGWHGSALGLTPRGRDFVREAQRLGLRIDVSHLSEAAFWQLMDCTQAPILASHSNCRALAPHCRNLTDEMIRAMAERGGLVGLNYCSGFLDNQPEESLCRSTVALMAKHAAHFKKVGGIEIIGLGSDFDGIGGELEMDDCSKLPLLAEALRREGFTEDEVEAIFYRNARRFFEENL